MVRCSNCEKSYKQHTGVCWNDDLCRKCWNKARNLDYTPPPIQTRQISNHFDIYLDKYTLHEVENLRKNGY